MLGAFLIALVLNQGWRSGVTAHWTFLPWAPQANSVDKEAAWFTICSGPVRFTCVIDGDTIWYRGEKVRLAGIDAPEVTEPQCDREAELGERATVKLRDLLNEGPFTLERRWMDPQRDAYDRSLLTISRDGKLLGDEMVRLGLAHRYRAAGPHWCDP